MPQSLFDPHFLADAYSEHQEDIGPLLDDPAESSLGEPDVPAEGTYNVPIALTENNTAVYGHMDKTASERNTRFGKEGQRFGLGPMPVLDFLEAFCPCPAEVLARMPPPQEAFSEVPEAATNESDIYEPLIAALNHAHNGVRRCPGHTFVNTSRHPDVKGDYSVKPDVTCYANEHISKVRINDLYSHTDMGYATFVIEVKASGLADFFADPYEHLGSSRGHRLVEEKSNEQEADRALEAFGQVISYAAEISARQFRCFCFSVCLFGCFARLMRWDRAGFIVTRRFDILTYPEILCEFVWRYAHMSEYQRGMDSTVLAATPTDEKLFKSAIQTHVALQLGLAKGPRLDKALFEHYQPQAVSVVSVWDDSASSMRPYLISRPLISPLSVTGRATRTYWAVDRDTGGVTYLKDTWRFRTAGAEMEGAIIAKLNEYGVRGIPTVLFHGHVPNMGNMISSDSHLFQHTLTQTFKDAEWVCDKGLLDLQTVVMHSHYRVVTSVAGYGVHRLTGTRELLTAGHQTLQTLIDAQLRNRLHRNIHPAAIVLHRDHEGSDRRAVLHDWDLSWFHTAPNPHAVLPHDAMWQFMSISVLAGKAIPHSIQDDMESLLYNMLYCSLRWLGHSMSAEDLDYTMANLFDFSSWCQGRPVGADGKMANAECRRYTAPAKFTNLSLRHWLDKLMDFHRPRLPDLSTAEDPLTSAITTKEWLVPRKLEDAWYRFLESTPGLPTCDRVARTLKNEARIMGGGAKPQPATLPSLVRARKRPAEEAVESQSPSAGRVPGHGVGQGTQPPVQKKRKVDNPGAIDLSKKTWEPLQRLAMSSDNDALPAFLERTEGQERPSSSKKNARRPRSAAPGSKAKPRGAKGARST